MSYTYNNILSDIITTDMSYDDFFDVTIRAGKRTALLNEEVEAGWFVLSEDILMPAIKRKKEMVHILRHPHNLSSREIGIIKTKLDTITIQNRDLIMSLQ